MKKIALVIVAALMSLAVQLISIGSVSALTCPTGTKRDGATVGSLAECNIKEDKSLISTTNKGINVIIGVVGLIAVIMIVIGGIGFATSQGDTAKTTKARNTILYGVIGLVVAVLAFAIVNFVIGNVF